MYTTLPPQTASRDWDPGTSLPIAGILPYRFRYSRLPCGFPSWDSYTQPSPHKLLYRGVPSGVRIHRGNSALQIPLPTKYSVGFSPGVLRESAHRYASQNAIRGPDTPFLTTRILPYEFPTPGTKYLVDFPPEVLSESAHRTALRSPVRGLDTSFSTARILPCRNPSSRATLQASSN